MSIEGSLYRAARERMARAKHEEVHGPVDSRSFSSQVIDRVNHYRPKVNGGYECPLCWANAGVHSSLRSAFDDQGDFLRCDCGHDIEVD